MPSGSIVSYRIASHRIVQYSGDKPRLLRTRGHRSVRALPAYLSTYLPCIPTQSSLLDATDNHPGPGDVGESARAGKGVVKPRRRVEKKCIGKHKYVKRRCTAKRHVVHSEPASYPRPAYRPCLPTSRSAEASTKKKLIFVTADLSCTRSVIGWGQHGAQHPPPHPLKARVFLGLTTS